MRKSRKETDHQRYIEKREAILAYQKQYRETHKEELREKRRQRNFEKIYLNPNRKEAKTREELNRSYYMRHREEILVKRKMAYERRKQQDTTTR